MPLSESRAQPTPSLRVPAPAPAPSNARPPSRGRSVSTPLRRAAGTGAAAAAGTTGSAHLRASSPQRDAPLAPPLPAAASPQSLTKTAARVVVKAVRNAIYPPKDNPFVTAEDAGKKSTSAAAPSGKAVAACMERAARESSGGPQRRVASPKDEKPGHHFLRAVRAETARLNALVEVIEREMAEEPNLPEQMQERLRAASGQARLLLKKKMQQFEGLCQKNITQKPGEGFPTTGQDLAGFWDMVKLQIDQVDKWFAEIDELRRAGWNDSLEATIGSGESEAAGAGAAPPRPPKKASSGRIKSTNPGHRRSSVINPDNSGSRTKFRAPSSNRGCPAERFQSAGKVLERTASQLAAARRKSCETRKFRDKSPASENRRAFGSP